MMISTAVFIQFVIIVMVIKGVFAARGCPDGWVPYAESCYLGLDGCMEGNRSTAVMQCDRNNASIMLPSSDWENEFIFRSFQHHGYPVGVWINIVMMLWLKVTGTATRMVNTRLNIESGGQPNQMMKTGQCLKTMPTC